MTERSFSAGTPWAADGLGSGTLRPVDFKILEVSVSADARPTEPKPGIENLYFPAIWTTTVGGGYLDFLLKAHGIKAKLGDLMTPVTIRRMVLDQPQSDRLCI